MLPLVHDLSDIDLVLILDDAHSLSANQFLDFDSALRELIVVLEKVAYAALIHVPNRLYFFRTCVRLDSQNFGIEVNFACQHLALV